jgi:DNA-binding GntR family transcriptional regulator
MRRNLATKCFLGKPMIGIQPQPILRRSLHDELVERLREMVLEGILPAGQRVPEKDLCSQFAVSRTPLREALKVLASEGLLELLPNRGAVVTSLTIKDVGEAFPVLARLEQLAGELACARIGDEEVAEICALNSEMADCFKRNDRPAYFALNQLIHIQIMTAARNDVLADMHRLVTLRLRRARYSANLFEERWRHAVEEHQEFIEPLKARDGKRLGALLKAHIENKAKVVLDSLRAAGADGDQRKGVHD